MPLTDDAAEEIARSLPATLPGKPVPPAAWHFTLRFLGATNLDVRDQLAERLSVASRRTRFRIQFGGLGAFPNPRRARILWLGVDKGGEKLSALAAIAEEAAIASGFPPEKREFAPHLTVSRLDPAANLTSLVASGIRLRVEMPVDTMILYRSVVGSGRPRYDKLAVFDLGH